MTPNHSLPMNESQSRAPLGGIICEIEHLPHFRSYQCSACGATVRVHALQIHSRCPQCGDERKCRGFGGIGTEPEDLIDAVLIWAGQGESFDAVMARRAQILVDNDEEQ